jgi:hypothetical protein
MTPAGVGEILLLGASVFESNFFKKKGVSSRYLKYIR